MSQLEMLEEISKYSDGILQVNLKNRNSIESIPKLKRDKIINVTIEKNDKNCNINRLKISEKGKQYLKELKENIIVI